MSYAYVSERYLSHCPTKVNSVWVCGSRTIEWPKRGRSADWRVGEDGDEMGLRGMRRVLRSADLCNLLE